MTPPSRGRRVSIEWRARDGCGGGILDLEHSGHRGDSGKPTSGVAACRRHLELADAVPCALFAGGQRGPLMQWLSFIAGLHRRRDDSTGRGRQRWQRQARAGFLRSRAAARALEAPWSLAAVKVDGTACASPVSAATTSSARDKQHPTAGGCGRRRCSTVWCCRAATGCWTRAADDGHLRAACR